MQGTDVPMPDSLLIEGGILSTFVILDGIWVVGSPPYGDEPQGYAIIAIGVFILLFTWELVQTMKNAQDQEDS